MAKKTGIDLKDIFTDDFDEDPRDYGYDDYKEHIVDNIYADKLDIDDIENFIAADDDDDVEDEPFVDAPVDRADNVAKPAIKPPPPGSATNVKPVVSDTPVAKPEALAAKPETSAAKPGTPEAHAEKEIIPDNDMPRHIDESNPALVRTGGAVPFREFSDEPPKGDNSVTLEVPMSVMEIIDLLKAHTYTCYLVGECVTMMYLGERVMDFDIACNASIERIIAIFDERFKTREDLLSRGELIIINGGMGISVAPYRSRIDGSGKPIYCKTIDEDLHRRTFTSETVAYNPYAGIYDPFGGLACITEEKTTLKAIDEEKYEKLEREQASQKKKREAPKKVVIEALRENPETILIAMQKYARGEAEISPYTLKNINDNAELLDMMMPTEIARYFRRIILGRRITETLLNFSEVVFRIFPQLRVQYGFDQKSSYQEYTMFEHTAKAVGYAFPDYAVRLALLLHAIGKYDCAADRGEHMTYYGHSERGVMLAKDVFEEEYEADPQVVERVLFMIMHHDDRVSPENVVQYTEFCGMEYTRLLLLMQSANIRAKNSDPVNERVSSTLRQLADNVATLGTVPRAQTRRTATIDGLRNITDMLGRNGV